MGKRGGLHAALHPHEQGVTVSASQLGQPVAHRGLRKAHLLAGCCEVTGAPDDVDKLVLSALPGVKLVHAPQVPAALPVRPDTYYFVLDSRGALYENMLKAQAMSIYVPTGMRDLKLDLIAISQ